MNINSIIEKILGNSIVGAKGNIELIEESRLLDLLKDGKHNGNQFHIGDHITARFRAAKTGNHRFPVTHFLYSMVVYVAKLLIFAFYWVASFIKRVITGKKCDLSQSPRFNFIIFFSSCTILVMLIVAVLVFFIKSVLLSPPDIQVNEYGAITMPQSCERESYMFLLNTARCWENSGIKVSEGDEVCITVSGSFFSDIDKMYECALNNERPEYERTYVSFDRNRKQAPDSTKDAELLMTNLNSKSGKTNNRFGLLLVQIRYASQSTPPYLDNIITQNESDTTLDALHFNAEESGYLYFAVNDEYITESWFDRIKKDSKLQDSLRIYNFAKLSITVYNKLDSAIRHDDKHKNDSTIDLCNYKTANEVFISKTCFDIIKSDKKYQELIGWTNEGIDTLTAWGDWDEDLATMWYDDNVGDVLINVKINRAVVQGNVFAPSVLTKSYRRLEEFFLSPNFGDNEIWILLKLLSLVALWFVLDWSLGYFNVKRKKKYHKHTEEPNDT